MFMDSLLTFQCYSTEWFCCLTSHNHKVVTHFLFVVIIFVHDLCSLLVLQLPFPLWWRLLLLLLSILLCLKRNDIFSCVWIKFGNLLNAPVYLFLCSLNIQLLGNGFTSPTPGEVEYHKCSYRWVRLCCTSQTWL